MTTTKHGKTLREGLAAFTELHMPSRNFSSATRRAYGRDLQDLVRFLERTGKDDLSAVEPGDLSAYMAALDRRGLAGTSRRRKTYAIKSFFAFLHDSGRIRTDPAAKLTPPKAEHKEPRVLTKDEYMALMRACSHHPRDSAIIELLLQTGIRLSEAVRLMIGDVSLPKRITPDPETVGRLHVVGKGRKARWIPLNHKACLALRTWLSVRPEVDSDALFISKFGKAMGPRAIQRVVGKYLRQAGIADASVHTLRHTFATHHVAQGTSLRTVQEVLGHADLKTTSIYVQLAQEAVKRELQEHAL